MKMHAKNGYEYVNVNFGKEIWEIMISVKTQNDHDVVQVALLEWKNSSCVQYTIWKMVTFLHQILREHDCINSPHVYSL
jgi:hypothetical protein